MNRDFNPDKLLKTPIDKITPNGWNPKEENTADFQKLKNSIKTNGLMGAIAVRQIKGGYEIIDGQQRYTAAKQLGYKTIYIYNEGKVNDTQAKALTIWWQQQVPFKPQLEAILVEALVTELPEIELPYDELELAELLMPPEIDLTQYFDDVTAQHEKDGNVRTLSLAMVKDKYDFIVQALDAVIAQEELQPNDRSRALELVCIEYINAAPGTTGKGQT